MPRVNSRRKGRRGETKAKHLLLDRNFTILADTTAGISTDDLVAQDEAGAIWSVEVKNKRIIEPTKDTGQAKANAGRNRWMLLAHIEGTSSWLVLRQAERPAVWHEKQSSTGESDE
jgi:Holliday junction resolvase-like predicted endonuclease